MFFFSSIRWNDVAKTEASYSNGNEATWHETSHEHAN